MLAVTYRPAADLKPYERNARTHSEAQIQQIAASIREFGWTNPVLVDEAQRVLAGHGRLAAASVLGQAEVPTICVAGLTDHATPKPVAMMERVMRSSLPPVGLCVEPFGGSGSTLIGAERTNRVCYTMEMQPRYVDVAVKRWRAFTGKQATLEATGETFDELAEQRLAEVA